MDFRLFRAGVTVAVAAGLALIVPAEPASAGQGYPDAAPAPSTSTPRTPTSTSTATPRTADGKPDLTGVWRSTARGGSSGRGSFDVGRSEQTLSTEADGDSSFIFGSRRCAPNQKGCRDNTNQANDYELTFRDVPNRPLYKAEHWDRVQFLDYDTNYSDPLFRCVPLGIPRVGPPLAILPAPNGFAFLYYGGAANVLNHDYRMIPTDGRPHDTKRLPGYWGDAVGRWEGDTLVVETIGFNDITWIASGIAGRGGAYFHSFELKVIERYRREGNTLHYQVTVEDPDVLLEPWTMDPLTLAMDPNPNALYAIPEGTPCENIDEAIITSRIRH